MPPTSSNAASQQREIVQHKGWLLKRGEGYEEEDLVAFPFLSSAPSASASTATATPKHRTTTNNGFGQAVANAVSSAAAAPSSTEPLMSNADAVFTALLNGLRGKSEKKRFFKLVRIEDTSPPPPLEFTPQMSLTKSLARNSLLRSSEQPPPSASSALSAVPPRVELRYYQDDKAEVLRGVIQLSADCSLSPSPEDASFTLQTPGRQFYLRPAEASVTSVTARTIAHQWADAVERELRLLFQDAQARKKHQQQHYTRRQSSNMSSSSSPSMNMITMRRESSFVMEEPLPPQSLIEILANAQSRDDFHAFLESALAAENLLFYEAVERSRTQQDMDEIMRVYVRPGSEFEVNLSGQQRDQLLKLQPPFRREDFATAKVEIFKLMETNFFKRFHREAVDKTGAFAALYATLGLDGYNVVLHHFGPIKTDLERLLQAMQCKLRGAEDVLQRIQKELASSSRDVAVREQSTSRRQLLAIYHATMVRMDALTDYADQMRTEVVSSLTALLLKMAQDLKTIHKSVDKPVAELEQCKRLLAAATAGGGGGSSLELENALEQMESLHTKPMESAMAKLESLELYRIETCREIMLYAVMAERSLHADTAKATELLATATKTVEMHKDIAEFAQIVGRSLLLMAAGGGGGLKA